MNKEIKDEMQKIVDTITNITNSLCTRIEKLEKENEWLKKGIDLLTKISYNNKQEFELLNKIIVKDKEISELNFKHVISEVNRIIDDIQKKFDKVENYLNKL